MAAIVLDGITKQFPDGTTAVHGLDLSIADAIMIDGEKARIDDNR